MNVPGGIPRNKTSQSHPVITAKPGQHQLHHITLAVVRRRRVGKNEQLHFRNFFN
jgi:hypothetical protein